jgi:uncharacterized membrane protein
MGLTNLGIVHTLLSLIAVITGFVALARDREITPRNQLGQVYVVTQFLTAATALGIFRHGGFGPPHALAILTIVVLGTGCLATFTEVLGGASSFVRVFSFSISMLFAMIPAVTETATRLPLDHPLLASAESPALQKAYLVLLVCFIVGVTLQLRRVRRAA